MPLVGQLALKAGQAGGGRSPSRPQDLLGRDEPQLRMVPTDHLERDHDVGHGQRVSQEVLADLAVVTRPVDRAARDAELAREEVGALVAEGVDERSWAKALVELELLPRPVEVAVVIEELEAAQDGPATAADRLS